MRFMVIIKTTADSEEGKMPSTEVLSAMTAYNEELVKAGVMLAGDGLHPSSRGARVHFHTDGKTSVVDGPFAETKELIAGYWLIQVASLEEAVEWVRRVPEPRPRGVRDRDPPGVRGRRLRRRADARAAREGRGAAPADRAAGLGRGDGPRRAPCDRCSLAH